MRLIDEPKFCAISAQLISSAILKGTDSSGDDKLFLACDMHFAFRGKAQFMPMEVGMGILPCGGDTRFQNEIDNQRNFKDTVMICFLKKIAYEIAGLVIEPV